MRRCAQSSQRSTCPPSAAVRQRSIADMTLSWPRLTWPAWDARQAGPRWRKMSATSTAGRDNGRASAGHLPQEVERTGHLADRADGDAGVERRRVAVAGKQPGLTGRHPALLARNAPPFMQYRKQDGRQTDVSILLAPRFREGKLLPCSTRMSIRSRSISVSLSDTTSEARRPVP